MNEDLHSTVRLHSEQIRDLRDGFDRHESFMLGHYDEHSGQWLPGLAQKLADAVEDVGDIRASMRTLTTWAQTSLARAIIATIGFVFTSLGAAVWFIATHFDKLVQALK